MQRSVTLDAPIGRRQGYLMIKSILPFFFSTGLVLSAPAWSASTIAEAVAGMQANSWKQISANTFTSVMTPPELRTGVNLDFTWPNEFYRAGSQIYAWTGSAWDGQREQLCLWGGDYNGHEGNEVYIFSANTGLWSRGSLPSQMKLTGNILTTADGIYNSPTSGETYDNLVFLKNVNRLAALGVSRDGQTWVNTSGQATGPYFWDPAKADANMVGGLTGSQIDPSIQGAGMWQNRNNGAQINSSGYTVHTNGTSDVLSVGGKDVVYLTDFTDRLWRYTVNDLNPANDVWEWIGNRNIGGYTGGGAGAIDTSRNIYLKTLDVGVFGFWDLGVTGDPYNNREIRITPTILNSNLAAPDTSKFGLEFDPVQRVYTMWDGSEFVWVLRPPDNLDPDGDGVQSAETGWTLERLTVAGQGPKIPELYTGVYGKWNYIDEYGVFMGLIDPDSGAVFLYKPAAAVPEPAAWIMMIAGLALAAGVGRRRARQRVT